MEGIQSFDGEYRIYFTRETGFLMFSQVQSKNEYASCFLFHSRNDKNSIFNVKKTLNFLFIIFSVNFKHGSFKSQGWLCMYLYIFFNKVYRKKLSKYLPTLTFYETPSSTPLVIIAFEQV